MSLGINYEICWHNCQFLGICPAMGIFVGKTSITLYD